MKLEEYTTEQLKAEIKRRHDVLPCMCGPGRRYIRECVSGFKPRFGCLDCNRWDSKPELE